MFQKKYSDHHQVGQKSDKNIRRRNAKFARLDHLKRCLFIEQAEEQKDEEHHVNSVRHRRGSLGNQENMNGSSGAFNDPNNENTKTSFASEDLEAAIIDGSLFLHNDKIDVQIDENNDQNQKGTGNRDDDDVEYENERDPDNDSLNDTGKDGSGKSDSSGSETEVEESDSVGLGSWDDFNNFPGNDGGDDADDYYIFPDDEDLNPAGCSDFDNENDIDSNEQNVQATGRGHGQETNTCTENNENLDRNDLDSEKLLVLEEIENQTNAEMALNFIDGMQTHNNQTF